jgi:hypothetical protein
MTSSLRRNRYQSAPACGGDRCAGVAPRASFATSHAWSQRYGGVLPCVALLQMPPNSRVGCHETNLVRAHVFDGAGRVPDRAAGLGCGPGGGAGGGQRLQRVGRAGLQPDADAHAALDGHDRVGRRASQSSGFRPRQPVQPRPARRARSCASAAESVSRPSSWNFLALNARIQVPAAQASSMRSEEKISPRACW